MLLPEHIELLKENPLFYSIETRKYEVLLETFDYRLEQFQSGEEITRDFDDIGILMSGAVRILKESIDNAETVVERVELGGVFGEVLTCLHTNGSPYKVMAETDSAVILIPYNNLLAPTEYQDHFTVLSNLMRLLSRRNLLVERKLEVLSKRTLADKILTFLAIQREVTGSDTFIIPYSRQQLSEYLCVDRSALSRELSNLKQVGLIKYNKNLFTIMTSYEDIDADDENVDVDDDDDFFENADEINSLVPNFEMDNFDNIKELPKPTVIDPIENELEDILNGDLDIDITKIEIDDEDIDNISIDDILNDNIQITTKLSSEETKTTPIFEYDDEDDFFTQEYAKLDDVDIDDLNTADVINEMIQDGVIEDVLQFEPTNNSDTPKKENAYDDINYYDEYETGDESSMSDALREEQSKVFAQFVNKAKEIASKNMQANSTPAIEAFADRLGEELLPKNTNVQSETPTEALNPVQAQFEEDIPIPQTPIAPIAPIAPESYEEVDTFDETPVQPYEDDDNIVNDNVDDTENVEHLFEEISIESYEKFTPPEVIPQVSTVAPSEENIEQTFEETAEVVEEYTPPVEQTFEQTFEETAEVVEEYDPPVEQTFEQTFEETAEVVEEYAPPVEQTFEQDFEETAEVVEEYALPVEQTFQQTFEETAEVAETYAPPTNEEYYEHTTQTYEEEYPQHQVFEDETNQAGMIDELFETTESTQSNIPTDDVVDERDVNLLLEPTETLVEKIAEEFAPKSIQEAVEKLKEEMLPNFAPFARDIDKKPTPTPEEIQQEIDEITEPIQPNETMNEFEYEIDEIDEIQESTVEEIVEGIADTLSKGKTKKQAKPNRLSSLFKKFKRE